MNKKLADVKVDKSADYYNKVVETLEDAGFLLVLEVETTSDRYYILAEESEEE